ncbi:SSI family serine proteinase inhibitor [Streptomyces mirabilis]|uniref:SSI family serine proteinase inhibitor n=1 Tax=Streptomyces mirabilis TaxID=68239 RepID=UPI0009447463
MNLADRARRFFSVSLAGAALLLPLLPGSANAAAEESGRLFLTIAGGHSTWVRGVQLACPARVDSHHPHADAACQQLVPAHGEPGAVVGEKHPCTREYDPVSATAEGEWNGRPLVWHKTYPNACALDSAAGPLFRF